MITLQIDVPKAVTLTPPQPAVLLARCNVSAGRSLVRAVKDNFVGLGGRSFYGTAARRTTLAKADAEGAEIAIAQTGVNLQWRGGTVKPTGKPSEVTGKPTKNLLVPVGNSELKKKRGVTTLGDLKLPKESVHVVKAKNGKVYLIADPPSQKLRRGKRGAARNKNGVMLGRLVKQVTIPAHPEVLPDAAERRRAIAYGARQALEAVKWFRAGKNS